MSGLLVRFVILAAVVVAPAGIVAIGRRRPGRRREAAGLPQGLTVFTAPGCRWCGPALSALADRGATPKVVSAPHPAFDGLRVRSVPTAVVVDGSGMVVMRRSGPVVVSDAGALAAAAQPPEAHPVRDRISRRASSGPQDPAG